EGEVERHAARRAFVVLTHSILPRFISQDDTRRRASTPTRSWRDLLKMYGERLINLCATAKRISVVRLAVAVSQTCCLLQRIDERCRSLAGLAAANRAT